MLFFTFFYVKNFEKKIFKKLSINWRYRVITILLDISTSKKKIRYYVQKEKKNAVFFIFLCKNVKKKIFKKLSIWFEISSKNHIFRYYYFHRNKWGITSKKKKNSVVFYIFYVKNFEKKIFKKLSINWRYRVKTTILDISTFAW